MKKWSIRVVLLLLYCIPFEFFLSFAQICKININS